MIASEALKQLPVLELYDPSTGWCQYSVLGVRWWKPRYPEEREATEQATAQPPPSRMAMKESVMLKIIPFVLSLCLVACGFGPNGSPWGPSSDDDDPLAADIEGIEATEVDQPPENFDLDSPCSPVEDQCDEGLTCRYTAEDQGVCRPVGTRMQGAACATEDVCGPNMTCLLDGGATRCFVLCRQHSLMPSCPPPQTCSGLWGGDHDVGICAPI